MGDSERQRARKVAAREGSSLNQVVVSLLESEVRLKEGWEALKEIDRLREQILAERGPGPDSAPLIRAWRDGMEVING